jgi:hypothetical protein
MRGGLLLGTVLHCDSLPRNKPKCSSPAPRKNVSLLLVIDAVTQGGRGWRYYGGTVKRPIAPALACLCGLRLRLEAETL